MARFQRNDKKEFPNVADACDALDLSVLSDIRENDDKPQPCYALGERAELAAGLRGFSFSPYFDSMRELDDFCAKHSAKIADIAALLEKGEGYPSNDWWK